MISRPSSDQYAYARSMPSGWVSGRQALSKAANVPGLIWRVVIQTKCSSIVASSENQHGRSPGTAAGQQSVSAIISRPCCGPLSALCCRALAVECPPAAQPPGEIRWGDDPYYLAIVGHEHPPGLAVFELDHHLVPEGIARHHDLVAERDHVIPYPARGPLVARHPANLPQRQQADRLSLLIHRERAVVVAHEVVVHGVLQGEVRRDPQQVAGHHVVRLDPPQHLPDLELLVGGPDGLDQEPSDEREPDTPGEIPSQQKGNAASHQQPSHRLATQEAIRVDVARIIQFFALAAVANGRPDPRGRATGGLGSGHPKPPETPGRIETYGAQAGEVCVKLD
jgi:hypothetical protein